MAYLQNVIHGKHLYEGLREDSISVQIVDGLTKARIKFRILEEN